MTVRAEIESQPLVITGLLEQQAETAQQVAQAIQARKPGHVFLAARGTSSHAGVYAQYLWGIHNRLSVALAAPSMFTGYGGAPNLAEALVVGISQSGQSPDIVEVLAEGRRQGALTLAITNDSNSPLAHSADFVFDVSAGVERAVAATKTYTAQLAALALISVMLDAAPDARLAELRQLPQHIQAVLDQSSAIEALAAPFGGAERSIVLGRGYNFATALEWALKLKELAAVAADPYSSAEFQHGPIALATPDVPVLAIAPGDALFDDLYGLLRRLIEERQVRLALLSDRDAALDLTPTALRLPSVADWLSPFVAIVAAQLFSLSLAERKGLDPAAPRGLSKVTLTR